MTYEQDKAVAAQIHAVKVAAKKEHDVFVANLHKVYGDEVARLKQVIVEKDTEIAAANMEVAALTELSQLRANLYSFSDTFHIAAKRIAETEDPVEEAKTLNELADQLLTVMGLPPRDPSEFA